MGALMDLNLTYTSARVVRAVVHLYEELQALARQPGFQGIQEEVCVVVDRTEGKPANFDVEVGHGGGMRDLW